MGLAASLWNPNISRTIPRFFGTTGFKIGETFLPWYRFITIMTGIGVGLLLRFLLYRSRLGVSMRAVVDNRELTVLNGARPSRASMTAWALGSSMAAIAGIFLAEELATLDVTTLTLFIIDAFAAAIIARLSSLPMAYVGGLIIGLALSFQQNFLIWSGRWTSAANAIPAALLFIALLFIPEGRIVSRPKPRHSVERLPRIRQSAFGLALVLAAVLVLAATLSRPNIRQVDTGILTAFIMLSLVPLTGWANQISLAQITLVGCGAFAYIEWGHTAWGLLAAAAFVVPIALLMAAPAVRLQGLYLALSTLAFARMAEFLFFDQPKVYGSANRPANPLNVFGWHVGDPFRLFGIDFPADAGLSIFTTLVFSVVALLLVYTRRRSFGRRLIAMRDSPSACVTLGLNLSWTKLEVFALSGAICGLAGALLALFYGTVGTMDFQLTVGLPYLLLLVVGGVATVAGAVAGGIFLLQFGWFTAAFPANRVLLWFQRIGPGMAGIGIGSNPDGVAPHMGQTYNRRAHRRLDAEGAAYVAALAGSDGEREPLPRLPARANPEIPVLELRDISVRFGGLQAVRGANIEVRDGTITGLIGPNGAGKTTLFNVASGLQEPEGGRIIVDGSDVTGARSHQLARLGLARTFQRLEIFGTLSVRDNIRVAAEVRKSWSHDRSIKPDEIADDVMKRVGLPSVALVRADTLPTGTARLLEVARSLATQPRVLLLDEPSSGLSESETETLVTLLREVAASGIAILVVEHDMGFIMDLCNEVIVLDAGEVIAKGVPAEVQANPKVLAAYLGSSAEAKEARAAAVREPMPAGVVASSNGDADGRDVVLELTEVSAGYGTIDVLFGIDLTLHRGEVCAVLGPNGAGKSTTLKVASGQLRPSKGTVSIDGEAIESTAPEKLVREGLCVVPEGRGIFPNLTVTENLRMASYAGPSFDAILQASFERFPILAARRKQLAGTLSGGEQQMLAIARALSVRPKILLLDELSMGLAPMVVEQLYEVIAQIAEEGISLLVVEQFAYEVLKVADVAALLVNGRITHRGSPVEIDEVIHAAYLGGAATV
jgi:sulfate-transporting ATPase